MKSISEYKAKSRFLFLFVSLAFSGLDFDDGKKKSKKNIKATGKKICR